MREIKKIENRKTVANKKAIKLVQEIMRAQFPGLDEKEITNLPDVIFGRQKMGFRSSLYVASKDELEPCGFIAYSYFPRYNFYFLDHMAAAPNLTGQSIGSALYRFLRAKAKAKKSVGIFFECLNDDPLTCADKLRLEQNKARLKFYEKFGARPLINNKYETKVKEENNSTLLVFDPLDKPIKLARGCARKIARKIIQKKYSDYCPPDYIKMVVMSFKDNPVAVRPPRYAVK